MIKRVFFLIISLSFISVPIVYAQSDISSGVAEYIEVTDANVPSGSLVSYQKGKFSLTKDAYDPTVYGIIADSPAVTFEKTTQSKNAKPLVKSGTVLVRVSAKEGAIAKGDLLTSSTTPGIAVKGTTSGYVIGPALDDFKPSNPNEIGQVPVNFHVFYFYASSPVFSRLFDVANLSTSAAYEQPLKVFKYVTASFLLLLSVILGFISFGRVATTGIEALGRNPLAARMIQFGIIVNVVITVAIILAGLALAFLVIRL